MFRTYTRPIRQFPDIVKLDCDVCKEVRELFDKSLHIPIPTATWGVFVKYPFCEEEFHLPLCERCAAKWMEIECKSFRRVLGAKIDRLFISVKNMVRRVLA